jgi:hypothetical protein
MCSLDQRRAHQLGHRSEMVEATSIGSLTASE